MRDRPRPIASLLRLAAPLLCIATLAACVSAPRDAGGLYRAEAETVRRIEGRLEHSPRRVRDPALEAYLGRLLQRIEPRVEQRPRVYLIDTPTPQADLVGAQVLRIGMGLLLTVQDEAELAFVLAHELAHARLDHIDARRRWRWDGDQAERDADRAALVQMQTLGYRPGAGAGLLRRMLPAMPPKARASMQDRIDALQSLAPAPDATQGRGDDTLRFLLGRYRPGAASL